ncbi:MAG: mannose-1-phosphate guanylyltransferase/mannose-6-phosphate isomerase [Burkholderiaceae bacterium]
MIPVVLSGGAGTRLWPVSREAFPKPFIRLGNGPSLLQRTLARAAPLADGHACVVTNEAYAFKTRDEIASVAQLGAARTIQLLEPTGRNTAPAVAIAALWARSIDPDGVMLVLPADHLIPDEAAFQTAARAAEAIARSGEIVLFGIHPTGPETGFGYLELGEALGAGGYRVARFTEKPDAERAAAFVASGNFAWNSGMFCFSVSTILQAFREHAPEVLETAEKVWAAVGDDAGAAEIRLDAEAFAAMPDISIDYAIMERADRVVAVRAGFGWSDIGSWRAIAEQLPCDERGNTAVGEVMTVGTTNTHIQTEDRLVAAVGVSDLLIVDTPDALLVANKDASQDVREIVARLKGKSHEAAVIHRTVARPWGTYSVLHEGPRFKIKRIEVKPGQQLSMQMHHHRSEHWVVVSGTAVVTCGEQKSLLSANESTYIPIGSRHRLENPGKVDLVMIEVQCGEYLGEDDIVRFDDRYGRA